MQHCSAGNKITESTHRNSSLQYIIITLIINNMSCYYSNPVHLLCTEINTPADAQSMLLMIILQKQLDFPVAVISPVVNHLLIIIYRTCARLRPASF